MDIANDDVYINRLTVYGQFEYIYIYIYVNVYRFGSNDFELCRGKQILSFWFEMGLFNVATSLTKANG